MTEPEDSARLTALTAGQVIVHSGDRVSVVSADLAAAFAPGDRLLVVPGSGDLLHLPAAAAATAAAAVDRAHRAFGELAACAEEAVTAFFAAFADRLRDPQVRAAVRAANEADVAAARARGRSTTRLVATDAMLDAMAAGLTVWRDLPLRRHAEIGRVDHGTWRVTLRRAPVGVIGFVFEGRPNVFADAVGVLRTGNTVVFRIGSDALGTARVMMETAVQPALAAAGLPAGAVTLLDEAAHAAGWALFADPRLALAVARGSGTAVAQLAAVARQAGVPVSVHGTGGAWILATDRADPDRLGAVIAASLDRKVCNTVNTVVLTDPRLVPVVVAALERAAAALGAAGRLHVTPTAAVHLDPALFDRRVTVQRATGPVEEPAATALDEADLGREWEWEGSPEISLALAPDLDTAIALFDRHSPRFICSLISADPTEHEQVTARVDAAFIGDGFTRWVDGQYALGTPELGLSNWEHGRLLARSGILSGDGVHTVQVLAHTPDPTQRR